MVKSTGLWTGVPLAKPFSTKGIAGGSTQW